MFGVKYEAHQSVHLFSFIVINYLKNMDLFYGT